MTQKQKTKLEKPQSSELENFSHLKTIYADKIVNFAIGPMVSKLILAQDNPNGTTTNTAQIVIPTQVLFDVVNGMHSALSKDEQMKEVIIDSLNTFKESLMSKKEQ